MWVLEDLGKKKKKKKNKLKQDSSDGQTSEGRGKRSSLKLENNNLFL